METKFSEELKTDLRYSSDQGPTYAVMTSQTAVQEVLKELESLRERVELFDWIKKNIGEIDFEVIVPPNVFSANKWIARGENFEGAISKAKTQLAACVAQP